LHPLGEILTRCGGRKRTAILLVQLDCLFDDLAELLEYGPLIVAMATTED
jgi:hypothetical protein